jgi:gliding motility-associated-like protein
MKAIIMVLLSGVLGFLQAGAQNITNRGREFYVGYGHHQFMEPGQPNNQEMILYFSAEQAAEVTVTVKGRTATQVNTYSVPANSVIASNLIPKAGSTDARLYDPPPSFGGNGGEGVFGRSIHIQSNVPIVAYAHIYGSVSSGATMLLPTEAWGYTYTSINSQQIDAGGPGFSWVYVVAQENNTVIRVTPSVTTRLGKPANVPFDVTLQEGEIYQFIGQSDGTGNGNQFTGSTVKSIANASGQCFPIAVFSGSSRTRGESDPCGSGSGRDNDMQQAFPQHAWGKRYLTAPFSTANGASASNVSLTPSTFQTSVYKIVVKEPGTVVRRNGTVLSFYPGTNYYQFSSNQGEYIESDKPIMVAQFMSGSSTCNPGSGSRLGDPEMVFLSPIEQAINNVGFYRNNRQSIHANYVTVVVPTPGLPSLRIDGSGTFGHTMAHPRLAGYSIVVRGWPAAQAQARVTCDSPFTAITYGLGSAESYAYNAGTYLKNLNAISLVHNVLDTTVQSHAFTCIRTPVELSVGMAYKPTRLEWQLSPLAAVMTPSNNVVNNAPVPNDSVLINGIKYYRYKLPGTYSFSDTGTFAITIISSHPDIDNCYNSEALQIEVTVKPNPKFDFTLSHTGCTADSLTLTAPQTATNGFTLNSWSWQLPGPRTLGGRVVRDLLPAGNHSITLTAVSSNGCVGDTTKTVEVFQKPSASFTVTPASICEGGTATFTDNSVFNGSTAGSTWYWDFGNGNTTTAGNGNPQSVTYPAAGTYTVRHVVQVSPSCISDTAVQSITVFARPRISISYPAGCLPASGTVQFNSTAVAPDGQAVTSYSWNFGDANATPGNPNTSTQQNPTHFYSAVGNYLIQYSATTANGCMKDTSFTATFNISPVLSYPSLPSRCEEDITVSIATATVTNGVPGSGVYRGPGTDAAGVFRPLLAGVGTHTIWYIFSATGGCIDSISQTVQVHARPRTAFTFPNGCLPASGLVQFTNSTTISDGQPLTYLWNFGDPNATPGNPNTSTALNPTHTYSYGSYTIRLTATSAAGCSKDSAIDATFNIRPLLSFAELSPVCENAAEFSIAGAGTVTNNVPGTGRYRGPGTTPAGIFRPDQAGAGLHTIWFIFSSTGGCTDSLSRTIRVHARPVPYFTFPAGCLPTTGQVQFTNATTISDGSSLTYNWNFGDPNANAGNPNTSTASAPSHNYTNTGSYTIRLTATSSNGCVSDTPRTVTFSVRPALEFPYLNSVCPSSAPVSIALATVTNNVTGTGSYRGPGTTAAGLFSPAAAGEGTHLIWYVFTSTGGCVDSVSRTIKVFPKPIASFSLSPSVCLNQQASFTDNSTISGGSIRGWGWNFGDGNTASYTSGAPFTRGYSNPGAYTVKLAVVSDSACVSDSVSRTVQVRPLPVANFSLPTVICMPDGRATFTNSSTVADNAALTYQWNFGDGSATSAAVNPVHTYASATPVTVRLRATSSFGCSHDTAKLLSAFVDQPVARFRVNVDTLCQGTDNVFTDLSTPTGGIQSWSWNFGDNSAPVTQQHPVKRYASPGNYTVSLTVRTAAGCSSQAFLDTVIVYLQPVIDAGPSFVVPQGTMVTFRPTANDPSRLTFSWTPAADFTNPASLQQSLMAQRSQTYRLTATGQGNCTATDTMSVRILMPVNVPNSFSPNGDGINDTWAIPNLADYPGSSVEVYNRYGQVVFQSKGYGRAWDGTYKGAALPLATYYYIIMLNNGFAPLKGSVTIIR